jgi:hypothetical protein
MANCCLSRRPTLVVLFIALHDWVPLGKLTNPPAIRATDTRRRLLLVTVLSALPHAIGFAASANFAATGFPMWLIGANHR